MEWPNLMNANTIERKNEETYVDTSVLNSCGSLPNKDVN